METNNFFSQLVLDHVAVVVKDLEASVLFYQNLGLHFSDLREEVRDQKVLTAFAPLDSHSHLELLTPSGENKEEGAIYQYLQKKGEGIHHLCFLVLNLEEKCEELKKKGLIFIYPAPRPGANNRLVNFIHPKSAGGVLIELSQKRD